MKMKILSAVFICLAFVSCKNTDKKDSDTSAGRKSVDSLLVTRESWGPITAESDLEDLRKYYGDQVVADSLILGPEGMDTLHVTYLLAGQPAELIVHWQDSARHRKIAMIESFRDGSPYYTSDSLKMGSTLREILVANGAPINFSGFGWDYGGYILSYNGGKLDSSRLLYRLTADTELPNELYGDQERNTMMPAVQQQLDNIRIYWLVLNFNEY